MTTLRQMFVVLLALAVALSVAIMTWLTHPTSIYYRHVSTQIERDEQGRWSAIVTRELPRGSFEARWSMEVWVRTGEFSRVCHVPYRGNIMYNEDQGPTVRYELPPEISGCLDSAPPISITWTRQGMAWGWIPLRPEEITITLSEAVPTALSDE